MGRAGCERHGTMICMETVVMDAEQDLVARAVGGDEAALSALLAGAAERLRNELNIGPQWRSVLEPDDVLQVTMLEAFLQIEQFQFAGSGAFYGWLKRIADNNLRDAIKGLEAQKRPQPGRRVTAARNVEDSVAALVELLGCTSATPSRDAASRELTAAVNTALAALPADYAEAIRRYDLQGQSIGEVAQEMGRTTGAVHMLRARGHAHLRELLDAGQFFSMPA